MDVRDACEPRGFGRLSDSQPRCPGWRGGLYLAAGLVLIASLGCETRQIGANAASEPGQRRLVFSDQFERDQLGPNWKRGEGEGGRGEWILRDGWLMGKNIHNDPLWLTRKLPRDVRIEFDAKARSKRGDLKVEIFGDGTHHESGYILIFGGWENKLDVIARLDEHGKDRKDRQTRSVEQGRVYHMAVERTGGTIQWFVDGEPFMSYQDSNPLRGPKHRYFAFNNWEAPVAFDNVEVYDLSGGGS